MKAALANRITRLEARDSQDENLDALSDEELTRIIALLGAMENAEQSGREMTDAKLANALGWSSEEVLATSAQLLAAVDSMRRQGRL